MASEPTDEERVHAATDLSAAVRALTDVVEGLRGELADQARKTRTNRIAIAITVLSVGLDLALTGLVFHQQGQTRSAVAAGRAEAIARCVSGNQFKADDLALWNFILSSPSTSASNPSREAAIGKFRLILAAKDAPTVCAKP